MLVIGGRGGRLSQRPTLLLGPRSFVPPLGSRSIVPPLGSRSIVPP